MSCGDGGGGLPYFEVGAKILWITSFMPLII